MGFQFGIEHVFPETIISYYVISTYFAYEICSFIFKMLKTFAQSLTGEIQYRSSRSQIFFKVGVLTNSVIFTGKHLGWNLFLTNLQAFIPATLLKRGYITCFSVNLRNIQEQFFLQNSSAGCLFLYVKFNVHNAQQNLLTVVRTVSRRFLLQSA